MRIGIEAQRILQVKKSETDIYALELINRLQQLDNVNQYFIFVRPGEDACIRNTYNFTIVEVKGVSGPGWEQWSLPWAVQKYNLDILHCTGNTAPLLCNVPVYLTLHHINYLDRSPGNRWPTLPLSHFYKKWIVPMAFKKATKVFTGSGFEKKKIDNHFGNTGKVEVIYNGVAHKFKILPEKILRKVKEGIGLPDRYLLFSGSTVPEKNMKGLLKAYAGYVRETYQPLPLVITNCTEKDLKSILNRINERDADLRKNICLIGYIHRDLLPAIYALAEVFLYPSLHESFGVPIIEAMACGVPVITSNTSSMPEIAGDCALLADPAVPQDMIRKIQAITQIPQFRTEMIKAGLSRAGDFSWIETAFNTLEAYHVMNKKLLKINLEFPKYF